MNDRLTKLRSAGEAWPSKRNLFIMGGVALAGAALANYGLARKAERDNPPSGRFIEVEGVRLHYVEKGKGDALVLLHGNGSMIQDFRSSGLIDLASKKHRVIVFDRPGYGHSGRPRNVVWTPEAQADLLHAAFIKLGVERAIIVGHSWGCSVAVALAQQHSGFVSGLVLASGYYYPTARADVVGGSVPAVPIIGDLIHYTVSPILSRLMWPFILRKLFGPQQTPSKFQAFPKEMAFRPSQIRAAAAESALMMPDAFAARGSYAKLTMPITIIAGAEDRLINIDNQSARLHDEIPHSKFQRIEAAGHMVHQTATEDVMAAITSVSLASKAENKRPA